MTKAKTRITAGSLWRDTSYRYGRRYVRVTVGERPPIDVDPWEWWVGTKRVRQDGSPWIGKRHRKAVSAPETHTTLERFLEVFVPHEHKVKEPKR